MPLNINHQEIVPEDLAFNRLDHVASALFPQYSRSRLQTWIKNGELVVDGQKRKSKDKSDVLEHLHVPQWPHSHLRKQIENTHMFHIHR